MNDSEKTKEQLIDEVVHLRDRLKKIESSFSPENTDANSLLDFPFLKNAPMGLRTPEDQILFTRFSIEVSADEVFWMRDDGSVLYANESACKRLGYTREELGQMYVWDWDPIFQKATWHQFWDEIQKEKNKIFETFHRSKDGNVFPVEIAASVFEYSGEKYLFAFVRDISERKQKELALQNEQEKYKTILELAVDGFWMSDLQGRFLDVNGAYCRMSGYSKKELLAMSIPDIEGKMKLDEVAAKIKEILRTGYARFETKHRRKDGSLYEVDVSVQYLQTEDGGRLVNFTRDISPQVLMEHSLRKREGFMRCLLKTLPDLIWLKDPNGVFLACNSTFESLFNAAEEEIVGKTDYDFVPRDIADFFREKDREALAASRPLRNEEWITFADDGHRALFETIKTPMFDSQGELIGVLGVGRDITERKQAEKVILNNERKFRNLLESTSTIPWEMDIASRKFTYMGKQIEQILGYPVESWTDIDVWEKRHHPDDQEEVKGYCEREIEKGRDFDVSYRAIHQDGSVRWIRDVVSVVSDSEGPQKLVGFMQDITRQRNIELEKQVIEARLQQAQKMEAIGNLAGGIAHDFNNILGVIFGYTELAQNNFPVGTRHHDQLDQVLIAANRAKKLVKQILTFSRQAQADRTPLKLQPLIKEGLKMLRSSIPSTISMITDIDPNSDTVLADPTQVQQILMNLCTNAYHAMENTGGTLSVTLKTIHIGSESEGLHIHVRPGEYNELTVSDTGCGIAPNVIGKIFDPYFTTKETGKGTGMGLAIAHGIVSEYGGTITVESEIGKGSTFHIYFPVIHDEALQEKRDAEDIPKGNERILLIDDEEILVQMGKDLLERLGYQVTARTRSLEALELFQHNPNGFDMVITDQTMPDMTGGELASQMMQIRPDIPIILCTGYSNLIDEESAKAMGIKAFALKPLTAKVLATLIRNVFDGEDSRV